MLLGFAVLVATFAGLSITTTANMYRLNDEIQVIQTGYLQLALQTRDLADRQGVHLDYLRAELVDEATPRRVETRVRRSRNFRDNQLEKIEQTLASQTDVPQSHRASLDKSREMVSELRSLITETGPLYETLLASPPLAVIVSGKAGPRVDPEELAAATEALKTLQVRELAIRSRADRLGRYHRRLVMQIAEGLERGSGRLRTLTIIFGVGAIVLGLLIMLWAIWNLRPLRRLTAVARRIADGDYGARIPERGPTEVAELAREFNLMSAALEAHIRELVIRERLATVGKMAAMITHEVRNPLSAIGLNTELLEEEINDLDGDTAEARGLCREINTEVDRLTQITETYLQFARLPQPKLHPEDLDQLVARAAQFVEEEMATSHVEIALDLAGDLPAIDIDHAQVRQALLNLMRNSAEALGDDGGRIEVATRASGDRVELRVSDNGPGIPTDVLGQLFEPFFTTKEGGTGLGLALTQQIIREHGGSIEVESAVGEGATFVVSLPLVRPPSLLAD
jgi:signal transduction histidine kinase